MLPVVKVRRNAAIPYMYRGGGVIAHNSYSAGSSRGHWVAVNGNGNDKA